MRIPNLKKLRFLGIDYVSLFHFY